MESNKENKEEIYKRLIKLEKEVEKIKISLNLESKENTEDQRKYDEIKENRSQRKSKKIEENQRTFKLKKIKENRRKSKKIEENRRKSN